MKIPPRTLCCFKTKQTKSHSKDSTLLFCAGYYSVKIWRRQRFRRCNLYSQGIQKVSYQEQALTLKLPVELFLPPSLPSSYFHYSVVFSIHRVVQTSPQSTLEHFPHHKKKPHTHQQSLLISPNPQPQTTTEPRIYFFYKQICLFWTFI